jgi:nitroreductase
MEKLDILKKFIEERRAIYPKSFVPGKSVPREIIIRLLENANLAPTHKRTEPWRFVVIRGESKQRFIDWMEQDYRTIQGEKFSDVGFAKFIDKPVLSDTVIALVMQRHEDSGLPEWEEIAATACAAQNFWLSACAAGLGTYWSTPSAINRVNSFLNLEANQRCLGFFYLGYVDEAFNPAPSMRNSIEDKIRWME